jgi:3-oxoacyl-[acyl-carrier-protein] synthase-3
MKIQSIVAEFGEREVSNDALLSYNSLLDVARLRDRVGVDKRYWTTKSTWPMQISKSINSFGSENKSLVGKRCVVISVSQTGLRRFPGYSNEIQSKLGLASDSICMDLSMGCSGYVYACYLIDKIMDGSQYSYGIIHTADAYNLNIDPSDAAILPLFGAASTLSLYEASNKLTLFDFMSNGGGWDKLSLIDDRIYMDGKSVYQYVTVEVANRLSAFIAQNRQSVPFNVLYLHQASKVTLEQLIKKLELTSDIRVPTNLGAYGNCTSSSIPLLIRDDIINGQSCETYCAAGFGVGLSYASMMVGL